MIREIAGCRPIIDPDAFVHPSAEVIGNVVVEAEASVWPCAVLRGDLGSSIRIGRRTNIQDGAVLHVGSGHPCVIGAGVTVGHRAVVHGAVVHDDARIGIGAIVLTGAVIESGAQVGAGALVPPGKIVPAGWLVLGVPAVPVRRMSDAETARIRENADTYVALWRREYHGKG